MTRTKCGACNGYNKSSGEADMKRIAMIGIPLCILLAGYLFMCYSRMEAYCFFYPSIDTNYAPGFTEQAFSKIVVGMTKESVQEQLGQPLYIYAKHGIET